MKGFYIENFALRLIFCVVGMFALWVAVQFLADKFIFHEEFNLGVKDYVIPIVMGVVQAFVWKPKQE